jgi:hypothetical protein
MPLPRQQERPEVVSLGNADCARIALDLRAPHCGHIETRRGFLAALHRHRSCKSGAGSFMPALSPDAIVV